MKTVLVVDVGNSRVKFGLFDVGSAHVPQVRSVSACRLGQSTNIEDAIREWLEEQSDNVPTCLIAGSNPPVRDHLAAQWPWPDQPPRLLTSPSQVPVECDVDDRESVGIDRLLTALAARTILSNKQPIVIIDSGTATTVNLVTSDGVFRGGAILPGLRLSSYALHDYTARLPLIETDSLSGGPATVDAPLPGRNTIDAMKAGLFWGQLGAARELASRLSDQATEKFGETRPPILAMTGGGGRQLVSFLDAAVYIDCLTLHGLAIIAADSPVNPGN